VGNRHVLLVLDHPQIARPFQSPEKAGHHMRHTYAEILAALPTLSKADLAQIRGAADSLLGPQGAPNEAPATPLLDVLQRALGLRLRHGFTTAATYKHYKRGETAVVEFVAKAFPTACDNRVTYNGVLSLMMDCLLDDLKERGVPISLGTVCSNLERMPEVFKAAFPGYIEGGLSDVILQRVTKGAL
jgi:hypothetical protein